MKRPRIRVETGQFKADRRLMLILMVISIMLAGRGWLAENPQHDPWAPIDLNDPPGWATQRKLLALRDNPQICRDALARSELPFTLLEPAGEGACRRTDRAIMDDLPLSPASPPATCAIGAGTHLWMRDVAQPAAKNILGSRIATVEHYGAYNCRRLYGRSEGRWSEHATGNAIDIAAFILEDGRRISVLGDWGSDGSQQDAEFLRQVRDGACRLYSTVLSPDYNEAHRDHFHFDQSARYRGVCR